PPATVRAEPQLVAVEPLRAEVLGSEPADQPGHARMRREQDARRNRVAGPPARADDGVGKWDGACRWRLPPDRPLACHLLDASGAGAGMAEAWRVEERALLRAESPCLVAGVGCGSIGERLRRRRRDRVPGVRLTTARTERDHVAGTQRVPEPAA